MKNAFTKQEVQQFLSHTNFIYEGMQCRDEAHDG